MYQDELAKLTRDELIALALAQAAQIEAQTGKITELARRVAELLAEAEGASADENLTNARRRLGKVEHEWAGLVTTVTFDAETAARFVEARARVDAREKDTRDADARARREIRIESLAVDFGEALAGAEHGDRLDRLVGRDHHHGGGAARDRRIRDIDRAEHVGLDAFVPIAL